MSDNKFIQTFESYRKDNKHKIEAVVETVKQVDDVYKVGSINIPQSLINSYVKKVKDETNKNLRNSYSDMEIAEELVKYAVDTHLNSDDLPVSALLGGENDQELGDDLETEPGQEEILTDEDSLMTDDSETDGLEETSGDTDEAELDLDSELDDESQADTDLERATVDTDSEFEEPTQEDTQEEDSVDEDEEEDELPI